MFDPRPRTTLQCASRLVSVLLAVLVLPLFPNDLRAAQRRSILPETEPADAAVPASPLAARLAPLLKSPALNPDETGLVLMTLPAGRTVFARNPDRLLRPASTLKIITSAAALALLKPEYVFETRLLADAPIDPSGAIAGNLYLQGSGDPALVGESFWLMARRLAAMGLRRVEGELVADDSYFDGVRRPPGWRSADVDSWFNAPVSALSCNFNVVTVRVDPSPFLGTRPDVTLEPIASYFQVLNRATTTTGPTTLSVTRLYQDERNTLVIGGTIRRGGPPIVANRAVEEPALYALHAFQEIARSEGISILGELVSGTTPDTARELHRHDSKPLSVLVHDMNKNSNNFMAEALVKTLGAQFVGMPGTTANGIEVMRTYLAGIGVNPEEAQLYDGSGLSDQDRVTARLLTQLLVRLIIRTGICGTKNGALG
ncbi:MAG TPA: D-alanyl-D-alanine carboxypeptidase/D-alanyl-D-alanine-endopeptidase, partial [Candidatus Polarisedimenticolia bacterium]|nr:D-alanyl-D-alanine carboxypeptidase/D-alanyl-D-alanine-endopeptidase [Candidatus Polarisedimenticolia bacterium]